MITIKRNNNINKGKIDKLTKGHLLNNTTCKSTPYYENQ